MMKTIVSLGVVLLLAGGAWAGFHAWSAGGTNDQFITAVVDRGPIVATISATGTVEPITKVLVGSQVSGTVIKWYADFNQAVRRDEKLLELDQDRYRTALQQRQADTKVARAKLIEAQVHQKDSEREFKRIGALFQRKAASENEHLVAQATAEAAAATVQASQAELDAARAAESAAAVDLSKTVITCPIDGIVISRDVDAGQTVAASLQAPTLFTIAADLRKMQVNANVAESDVGRIREGMPADFRVDAYPDRKFRGRVSQVRFNPTIIDNIVTYVTLVDIDNNELLLRPGMTANITFEVARVSDALRIPNAALRFSLEPPKPAGDGRPPAAQLADQKGPRVYKLAGGRADPVTLAIGLTDGSFTEIRKGSLAKGDQIIVDRRWSDKDGRRGSPRMPRSM